MSNLKKFRINQEDNQKRNALESWKRRTHELLMSESEEYDDDIDFDREDSFQGLKRK
jgi:hypothetical protein